MSTNFGKLRETLMSAIEEVRAGNMGAKEAQALAKLAAQVTNSVQVEINAIKELRALGAKLDMQPGHLSLGQGIEIEPDPAPASLPATAPPRNGAVTARVVKGSRY